MTIIARPPRARRFSLFAALLGATALPTLAWADDAAPLPDMVVTADRVAEPVSDTGSAITVIPGSRIAQDGAQGITETLREVAGVEVTPNGGPGSATTVRIRGADPGADSGADRRPARRQRLRHRRLARFRQSDRRQYRPHRGSARAADRPLRLGRHGRRHQHHHQEGDAGRAPALGFGRRRQLRHDFGPGLDLGRRRPLDLFARRQHHVYGRLSAIWLSHQPPVDDRRRGDAAAAAALGRPQHQGRRERSFLLQAFRDRQRRFRLLGLRQRDALRQSLRLRRGRRVLAGQSFCRLGRLGISAFQFRSLRRRAEKPFDLFREHHPEPGVRDRSLLQCALHLLHLHDDLSWRALGRRISGRIVAQPLWPADLRRAQRG